jgi:cap2 methyltransferase
MKKWTALESNPHAQQASHPITNIPFARTLEPDAPKKPYRRRADEEKTAIHWGQRKLLMSEIEFLLLSMPPKRKKCVVVYAGAAPGTHVRILADLFPSHLFVLVDPAPFTVRPEKGRIVIHQCMFTDELAKGMRAELEPKKHHLLFISDVRSCDLDLHSEQVYNERINADMQSQAQWHKLLLPFKSMLKFRLPYAPGKTEYLSGGIHLPVWGPGSTTECRLVVDTHPNTQIYDHVEHEQRMFHFNTVTRVALYKHSVRGCGIDHCFDCTSEVTILTKYLRKMHPALASDQSVAELSAQISAGISANRTLEDKNPDREQKLKVIRRNQWLDGEPSYEKFFAKGGPTPEPGQRRNMPQSHCDA